MRAEITTVCMSVGFESVFDCNREKKFRNRAEGNEKERLGEPSPPERHPEAQRRGEVGLMCHNRSRSKWKDDPNIWLTALSFITPSFSLWEIYTPRIWSTQNCI